MWQVVATVYNMAKVEELEPYFFTALRPLVPVCLCCANAKAERELDPTFLNMKVVGHNWAERQGAEYKHIVFLYFLVANL